MFYANFILSKKGPLARVWLAAHWEKKLSKAHVFETDVESSVESIMSPKVKMALRTSGHLLLGVVRIYSRKAKYLLADCTEAFVKIKMAFRPGLVDLPEDSREAAMSAVTLPEVFNDFDMPLPGLNDFDIQLQFNLNQSRAEEITLKEDFIVMNAFTDEGFGESTFDEKEIFRDASVLDESSFLHSKDGSKLILEDSTVAKDSITVADKSKIGLQLDEPLRDDDFGGLANDILGGDGFGDELGEGILPPLEDLPTISGLNVTLEPLKEIGDAEIEKMDVDKVQEQADADAEKDQVDNDLHEPSTLEPGNETTVVQNDAEAFVLEPVEVVNKEKRSRRKRKLIVDDDKILDSTTICNQLANTEDIVKPATLAPPTKLRMRLKEASTSEKLFTLPTVNNIAPSLSKLLVQNLTAKIVDDHEEPTEQLQLDDIESPRDAEEEVVEEVIKSPKSPRKRRAAQSIDAVQVTHAELPSFEESAIMEDAPQQNLEDGGEEFIPEENGIVDEPTLGELDNFGSQLADEQASNEREEEFIERRWTKRTQQLMHTLKRELKQKKQIKFSELAKGGNRKQVACKYYSLLLLKRDNEVEIDQKNSFQEIYVSKGPCFYSG